jgi:hypothetical protein
VILEAMGTGTPVAAYPGSGPDRHRPGLAAPAFWPVGASEGLREACLEALKLDRKVVRAYAETFSWRACAEDFVRNLQPYPEPEKTRFWRRLRRLARVRRRRPEAALSFGRAAHESYCLQKRKRRGFLRDAASGAYF